MEEQLTTPSPAARTSRTVPLLVLLVLIAAAVVGAYVVISRRGVAPDPASFIPRNAAVAMTLDLTQTPEKLDAYDFVNGLFKEAGQDKALDTLFQEISKGLKLDFKKDVVAHLNGTVAGAVLDEMVTMPMPMPKMVAVIGAKSSADADAIALGNSCSKTTLPSLSLMRKKSPSFSTRLTGTSLSSSCAFTTLPSRTSISAFCPPSEMMYTAEAL